jgi:hypothetical protein
MKFEFSPHIFEKTEISYLIKIRAAKAELFHEARCTDGRTDGHDKAISPFPQLCKRAYKIEVVCKH